MGIIGIDMGKGQSPIHRTYTMADSIIMLGCEIYDQNSSLSCQAWFTGRLTFR
jgi:hypothetical protein